MTKKNSLNKDFDCVAMKREIQKKLYHKTKDMSADELLAYYDRRAKNGRFSYLFAKQSQGKTKKGNDEAA